MRPILVLLALLGGSSVAMASAAAPTMPICARRRSRAARPPEPCRAGLLTAVAVSESGRYDRGRRGRRTLALDGQQCRRRPLLRDQGGGDRACRAAARGGRAQHRRRLHADQPDASPGRLREPGRGVRARPQRRLRRPSSWAICARRRESWDARGRALPHGRSRARPGLPREGLRALGRDARGGPSRRQRATATAAPGWPPAWRPSRQPRRLRSAATCAERRRSAAADRPRLHQPRPARAQRV